MHPIRGRWVRKELFLTTWQAQVRAQHGWRRPLPATPGSGSRRWLNERASRPERPPLTIIQALLEHLFDVLLGRPAGLYSSKCCAAAKRPGSQPHSLHSVHG